MWRIYHFAHVLRPQSARLGLGSARLSPAEPLAFHLHLMSDPPRLFYSAPAAPRTAFGQRRGAGGEPWGADREPLVGTEGSRRGQTRDAALRERPDITGACPGLNRRSQARTLLICNRIGCGVCAACARRRQLRRPMRRCRPGERPRATDQLRRRSSVALMPSLCSRDVPGKGRGWTPAVPPVPREPRRN